MKVKGFKLVSITLATTLVLALAGCSDSTKTSSDPVPLPIGSSPTAPPAPEDLIPGTDVIIPPSIVDGTPTTPLENNIAEAIYLDKLYGNWTGFVSFNPTNNGIEVTEITEVSGNKVVQFASEIDDIELGFQTDMSDDVSEHEITGALEFEIKVVAFPESDPNWVVKVESGGGPTNDGEYAIFTIWQSDISEKNKWYHVVVPLTDLINDGNRIDLTDIDRVVVSPAYGSAAGVIYQLDNVHFTKVAN